MLTFRPCALLVGWSRAPSSMIISSRQHPIVDAFRELADAPDTEGRRLMLDGVHLISDARRGGLEFELVVVATGVVDQASETADIVRSLEQAGVEILTATTAVMAAISPVHSTSPIVAIVRREPFPAALLTDTADAFLLVAHDVQDPGNLGSLLRAGEAAGVNAAIVCGASAHPFGWKAVRGSMGTALRLPIATGRPVHEVISLLKASGARLIGAVPRHGVEPDAAHWRGRVAIVLGGEGNGLDQQTIEACDELVTIPMADTVESLNVAVAGALLCYAARRQRA
jgi:TrmH family RNA methyltransferase